MSSAVNRPTDIKQKEADVNRKLQFYGIATGMSPIPDAHEIETDNPAKLSKMEKSHP